MTLVDAPDLHPGSSGQWVTYLQQLLEAADVQPQRWTVPITGHFDAATEHAVKAFQHFCGWPQDGKVDAQLWLKLADAAQDMEQTEETIGQLAGDENAGHHAGKLDAGQEAGRKGWHAGNLTFDIQDFDGERLSGPAYVRLQGEGHESDEAGMADTGTFALHNVWIPDEGTLTLYVSPPGGAFDHLYGVCDLMRGHPAHLWFECKQAVDNEPIEVTRDDAGNWTDTSGATVHAGIDVKIAQLGADLTGSSSVGGSHAEHIKTTAHRVLQHMDITLKHG